MYDLTRGSATDDVLADPVFPHLFPGSNHLIALLIHLGNNVFSHKLFFSENGDGSFLGRSCRSH
jgi:hypothetical protein